MFDKKFPLVTFIDTQESLNQLVEQLKQSNMIALDTEFVRTRTYYAQLGLIQVYNGDVLALIDPVSGINLTEFWGLLKNENILKVLHSASEDLEVFAHYGDVMPTPYFDSQIGAGFAKMGHGLGYANLVHQLLGIELDKGESRTDWIKRPLSDKQLTYAANDVFYLYHLFPMLKQKLEEFGRWDWALEESANMCQGRLDAIDYDNAYLKVKNGFQLSQIQLAYLKPIAKWRLKTAVKKDIAVGFIIKDHALIALAKSKATTFAQLSSVKELNEHEKRKFSKHLLSNLQNADLENLPQKIDVIAFRPDYKQSFKTVKSKLVSIAENNEVPIEIFASKKYIHDFLSWYWSDNKGNNPKLLVGWRGMLALSTLSSLEL
ncbi:ribonuclease D [Shewanella sp. 202IG2-18]|nr:ribonuclease D [Parashewanella hymeniacidonis]